MTTVQPTYEPAITFDFRRALEANRLKGLWKMMVDYRLPYIGATAALAVSALAKTFTYLLLRYFVDDVLTQGRYIGDSLTQTFIWIGVGFIGLALFEGGFSFLSGRLAAYTAEGITRRLRDFLFDHIQRLSFSYHATTPTGDLIERVTSDVDALRRFFSEQGIGMGRIVMLFVINFIAILSLNVELGLISVVVIPFMLWVSLWFFKKVTKAYEAYQAQEAVLSTTLQENLTGVRVVKAFARQDYEKNKFEKDNWGKYLKGKILLFMHSMFWPLSDIVLGFQMLFGFVYAANMAINGEITVGMYIAYVGLVVWLIWPIRNLGRIIVSASTGMVSYGRLMEVVKQAREPLHDGTHQPAGPVRGDIDFRKCLVHVLGRQVGRLEEHLVPRQAGSGDRIAWFDRVGQDITGQPPAEVPRIHRRANPAGRCGVEGLLTCLPAQADRHCGAGTVPVQPLDPREHHLWCRAGRDGRGSGARRKSRGCP